MKPSGNSDKYEMFTLLNLGMILIMINILLMTFGQQTPKFYFLIYISLPFWLLSVILWISGLIALKKHGAPMQSTNYMTTSRLVDTGIYSIIRHPQYTAFILFNLGIMLKVQTTLVLLIGIFAIVIMIIGMKEEERKLLRKFGDAYRNYMKKVIF